MKRRTLVLVSVMSLFLVPYLYAQKPDLTVSLGNFSPLSIMVGQWLTIDATVKNQGNAASGFTHLAYYIASDPSNMTQGYLLGETAVEPLAPGTSSSNKQLVIPLRSDVPSGQYYVGWNTDDYGEVGASRVLYLPSPRLSVVPGIATGQHIPYPIILVHGLASNDKTWEGYKQHFVKLGWSYGGRFDFCLNQDGNLANSVASSDVKDYTNIASLAAADYYVVNFDVDRNGVLYNNTVESNQSAVVKQGLALKSVIRNVLALLKKEKVVLVGHSMGGLAAREYLQNSSNWPTDGQHHVAKLLTLGTPHGGSNASTFGLYGIIQVDGYSEAVRDLRWSYWDGTPGVYLFGGNERDITTFFSSFYNLDVDCNGVIGDNITGLNKRNIPTDLSYACAIGTASPAGGDGLVDADRANINSYYKLAADTFKVDAWHSSSFSLLGDNLLNRPEVLARGLDEPGISSLAYRVNLDTTYFGFISPQSGGNPQDMDFYRLTAKQPGSLSVNLSNIPISSLSARVYDVVGFAYNGISSNGQSQLALTTNVPAGDYYIVISGYVDQWSWRFPYGLTLRLSPTTGLEQQNPLRLTFILGQNYPNPFNPRTTINYQVAKPSKVLLKVYNMLGEEIAVLVDEHKEAGIFQAQWNALSVPSGVYFYRLQAGEYVESKKMILLK
ncbi:MAG: alpha/beta fold hydrolase [Ignavibacteriales bacterium]|nr:alpha/beta fold hydrolase [Ignavibacteriales bacterium]